MGDIEKAFAKSFRFGAFPSVWAGMASVLDLGVVINRYNISTSEEDADIKALQSDWNEVGKDMQNSVKEWELKYAAKTTA